MIQLTELIKNIDDLEIFGSNQIAVQMAKHLVQVLCTKCSI